jgi:hypothetical protein
MELLAYILSQYVHCWYIVKATDFCIWEPMQIDFIPCYFGEGVYDVQEFFLGLLGMRSLSSANRNGLTSSFPVCVPFISSSCLIALARNSYTMFNKSGKSEYPCLIPDFRGNGFSLSPFSMMLAISLSYIALITITSCIKNENVVFICQNLC